MRALQLTDDRKIELRDVAEPGAPTTGLREVTKAFLESFEAIAAFESYADARLNLPKALSDPSVSQRSDIEATKLITMS